MTSAPAPGRLRQLARTFGPDVFALRGAFIKANLITLTAVAGNALAPWPLKWIIDRLIAGPTAGSWPSWMRALGLQEGVLVLGGVFLVIALGSAVAEAADAVIAARIRERLAFAIRDRMLAHLQTLPPTIRTTHRSGELVMRIVGDVDQFTRFWTKTVPLLVKFSGTLLFTAAGIAWLSPWMGLSCLVFIPLLWTLVRFHGRRVAAASRTKRRREGEVAAVAQEIVRGLPVIQALGATEGARQRFATVSAEGLRAGVQASRAAAGLERGFGVARAIVTAAATIGGALLVIRGWMTVGELTVVTAYVAQLVRPIDKVNEITEAASKGLVSGERLMRFLGERPLVEDAPGAMNLDRAAGLIELQDAWFSYPADGAERPPVLRGVNMRIEPGALTVLVGMSGAGKSTLISLCLRLFDPTTGTVRLDGRPLDAYTIRSLRSQFAVMTQDLHLFSGTLRQALTTDAGSVDERRIRTALSFVALDEFVASLPVGLDTTLGEDGVNLSGGQRQRLSLARAFLLDRPILLLDEPLANVDAESARVILDALERLRAGRTCLAITHESTLVSRADVVYRIAGGTVRAEARPRPMLEIVR
ncbi:MAG: ABC transporter ATP-binding protein [Vicinamibacterales bacterium]